MRAFPFKERIGFYGSELDMGRFGICLQDKECLNLPVYEIVNNNNVNYDLVYIGLQEQFLRNKLVYSRSRLVSVARILMCCDGCNDMDKF